MKYRILSLLLILMLLLTGMEPPVYSLAASPSPNMGGCEFETAEYGSGLDGARTDLYPDAEKPYNYQYLSKNGTNTYTSLWITPKATLSFENVGDASCTYHCFATTKTYPVASALENASYKTIDKTIHGDASFFPDITGQNFAMDFSSIPDRMILDDIHVDAQVHIGGSYHTFRLADNEIVQLTNAIKNRTRYIYHAGKDIYIMNLDVHITGAYSDYTVYTLNAGDGNAADKSLIVRYNHPLEHLPVPERTGYIFTGWFTSADGGTQILPSHINHCEANQTLYAHWSPSSCTVTCIDKSINGKELGTIHATALYDSTLYGSHFGAATTPNTYYKGYCYSSCSSQKVTADGCMVYRYFTPLSVKVTLEPMGGNLLAKEFQAVYDSPLSLLCSPVRTGYQFNGWWTEDASSPIRSTDSSFFTEDTLLRASWIPDTHTPYAVEIRQKNLAGMYETVSSFQRYGTTDTLASVSPEDYTYEGFHYEAADSLPAHNLNGDGGLVLHLNYERNLHRLTFDINPGRAASCAGISIPDAPDAMTARYGETVLLPEPETSIAGYTFGGWSLNPAATQAVYDAGKTMRMEDKNCTLYAVWIPREDTEYSVYRFQKEDSGQYTLLTIETHRGRTDAVISYTDTQTPDGYHINRTVSQLSGRILPDGSLALVIRYDPISYEISFHSVYDRKTKLLSRTYLPGEQVTLPGISYKRTGYIQTGWTDAQAEEATEDATPKFVPGQHIIMESHDLHLSPTWKSTSPTSSASPANPTVPDANQSPVPAVTPGTNPDTLNNQSPETPGSHPGTPDTLPGTSNKNPGTSDEPVMSDAPSYSTPKPATEPLPAVSPKAGSKPHLHLENKYASLSKKKISLGIGETYKLSVANGKISSVTFSEKYICAKQKSKRKLQIKALKRGTTTLSVKTKNGEKLICKIIIKKAPQKIHATKKHIRLKKGSRKQIHIKRSKGSACMTYRYTSSAPEIASVSSKGQLTGRRKGACQITITSYNRKKTHLQVQVR